MMEQDRLVNLSASSSDSIPHDPHDYAHWAYSSKRLTVEGGTRMPDIIGALICDILSSLHIEED